jgi:uncharacterized protein YdeI (YjbR/CyaY-like superfamily)
LREQLDKNRALKQAFEVFLPYKQQEFCEYMAEAKQENKQARLEKIKPMIEQNIGLNDK